MRIKKLKVLMVNFHFGVQEKMAEMGNLSILVKSLGHDLEEQKEAVGLLVSLSDVAAVRRRVGRIRGCIVMLVQFLMGMIKYRHMTRGGSTDLVA